MRSIASHPYEKHQDKRDSRQEDRLYVRSAVENPGIPWEGLRKLSAGMMADELF